MTDSHHSVEEEVERALRLGLATAAQLADRLARARQELAQQAQHRSEVEARHLEARTRAEAASVTARLSVVDRTEWWDRATTGEIVGMYELAAGWQHDEPHAAIAVETITRQVHDRFGIDAIAPGVTSDEIRAALARIELDRGAEATQHEGSASSTAEAVAAVLLANQRDADLVPPDDAQHETPDALPTEGGDEPAVVNARAGGDADRVGEPVGWAPYDSERRRAGTAAGLREAGLSVETIAVAMRADVAHARPAVEAATASTHSTTLHQPRARGTSRSAERSSRER